MTCIVHELKEYSKASQIYIIIQKLINLTGKCVFKKALAIRTTVVPLTNFICTTVIYNLV